MRKFVLLLTTLAASFIAADDLRWYPLPSFAPDGAAIVVHAQKTSETFDEIVNGPIADIFREGAVAKKLKKEGVFRKINRKIKQIEAGFGIDLLSTLNKIAGTETVFALYPGRSQKKPYFILLLRGKEGADSQQIISDLYQKLVEGGDIQALSPISEGDAQIQHYKGNNGDEIFTCAYGEHSVTSNSLKLTKQVIGLAEGTSYNSIIENPRAKKAFKGMPQEAQINVFIDANTILNSFNFKIDKNIKELVKTIEGIGISIVIKDKILFSQTRITADPEGLPKILIKANNTPATICSFAKNIQRDFPLAGIASHVDFSGIANAFLNELPKDRREQAKMRLAGLESFALGGKSLLNDLLPNIGPNLVILASDADETDKAPGEITLILEVKKQGKKLLTNLVRQVYNFSQFNQDQAAKTTLVEKKGLLLLSSDMDKITPAIAVTNSALIISSSKTAAQKIINDLANPPADNLGDNAPKFKAWFFGANLPTISGWLIKHSELLAKDNARKKGTSLKQSKAEISLLADILSNFKSYISTGGIENEAFEAKSILIAN